MSPSPTKRLLEHWQDEGEAALLYETLAGLEKDERRKKVFARMAEVERRHQKDFADRLAEQKARI
ncbi:MAG: hypothetical protein NTW86_22255, partial [Candidatus Sumerlaeota bacterium]|nr:hypothetical protein [Candidatus Sumerlaeota bacterium]